MHNSLNRLGFTEKTANLIAEGLAKINPDLQVAIGIYSSELSRRKKLLDEIRDLESRRDTILIPQVAELERKFKELPGEIETLKNDLEEARRDFEKGSEKLNKEIDSLTTKRDTLERETGEMANQIALASSLMLLLSNPRSITNAELDDLIKRLNQAKSARERGFGSNVEREFQAAATRFVECLLAVPGLQIVSRSQFDRLDKESKSWNRIEMGDKSKIRELEGNILGMEAQIKAIKEAIADVGGYLFGKSTLIPASIGYTCDFTQADVTLQRDHSLVVQELVEKGYYEEECGVCKWGKHGGNPHMIRLTFASLLDYATKFNLG